MPASWRTWFGPFLVVAAAALVVGIDDHWMEVPNPAAVLLCAVAVGSFLAGLRVGLIGAAIAVAFGVVYYSEPTGQFQYETDDLARLVMLAITAPLIALMIGVLRLDVSRTHAREQDRIAENTVLRMALDRVEYGVVLLDAEMRAQFINRPLRSVWKLSDADADAKPPFVALMYHGRDTQGYGIPPEEMDSYIAQRVQGVRAGDSAPQHIKLADSQVIRFQCIALPDGGRMLSYVPVTDLFRHAEQLETLATIDGLTGVYNRRHFLELAEAEWARFQRYYRPLALVMLDIDYFKSVNDCFGHDTGDAVLADFAQVCREMKRTTDIVGRIGGEEFVMLLPETELKDAQFVAERLRQKIEARVLTIATETLRLTVSAGVAQASLGMSGFTRLLKAADEALYQAKQNGRNQVVTASPSRSDTPYKVAAE